MSNSQLRMKRLETYFTIAVTSDTFIPEFLVKPPKTVTGVIYWRSQWGEYVVVFLSSAMLYWDVGNYNDSSRHFTSEHKDPLGGPEGGISYIEGWLLALRGRRPIHNICIILATQIAVTWRNVFYCSSTNYEADILLYHLPKSERDFDFNFRNG